MTSTNSNQRNCPPTCLEWARGPMFFNLGVNRSATLVRMVSNVDTPDTVSHLVASFSNSVSTCRTPHHKIRNTTTTGLLKIDAKTINCACSAGASKHSHRTNSPRLQQHAKTSPTGLPLQLERNHRWNSRTFSPEDACDSGCRTLVCV